jgi:predicted enzyme related to lactoylglutathione lyase
MRSRHPYSEQLRSWLLGLLIVAVPPAAQAAGEVDWFSLFTEDAEAAATFYAGLLGWEIQRGPAGGLMALRRGTPVAGITQIEDRLPGTSESLWLAAIKVRNLAESVAVARERGGTIQQEVTHVPGYGSYAVVIDPQGAPAVLAVEEQVLGANKGVSAWLWAELWTTDTDAASQFYADVVGYTRGTIERDGDLYPILSMDGSQRAGLTTLNNPEISPRWAPYVGVQDLRATLVRVWQLQGQVLLEPAEIDDEERTALIADPTGGALFLYELTAEQAAEGLVSAHAVPSDSIEITVIQPAKEGPRVNFNVSLSYGYGSGYGAGWGGAYPRPPYYPYRPPIYY